MELEGHRATTEHIQPSLSPRSLADELKQDFGLSGPLPSPYPLADLSDSQRGGGLNIKGREVEALQHSLQELSESHMMTA